MDDFIALASLPSGPGGSLVAALPPGCERPTQLFVGGRRMTPARHPNGDASLRINRDAPKGASLLRCVGLPSTLVSLW